LKNSISYISKNNFNLFLIGSLSYGQNNNFRVALDAGHGAHDFGASYNGHVEKPGSVVLKVGRILEAIKIDVIYTRKLMFYRFSRKS
jgi:N-acetylmuramoyl-L-alanine amidase